MAEPAAPGVAETPVDEEQAAVFRLESLRGKEAGDNRVFQEYDPAGRVRWNTGWPGRVDLTGISWDSGRPATAITPRHVVMAAHYSRRVGDAVVFHDREGRAHRRKLVKLVSLRGKPDSIDIAVGLLDRPLPDLIKSYPLLPPRADYAGILAGGLVLVTEQKRRLFIHEVRYVMEKIIQFTHDRAHDKSMLWMLRKGDSGYPAFMLVGGEPVLLETHSSGGPGAGPFYSAPACFKALQGTVRNLDSRYRIKTVALEAKFVREAPNRLAEREKTYALWNTDGSRVKPVVDANSGGGRTKTAPPPKAPKAPPRDRSIPRVRRVPTPNNRTVDPRKQTTGEE